MSWQHRRSARALVATVLVALCGLAGAATASAESNDTMAGAEGPLIAGSISGAIDTQNDADWYFMWAAAYTQIDVAITGLGPEASCQSWELALIDSEGHELESVHAGFNHVRHILYTLEAAGTYYLAVTGFYCEAAGDYRVDLAASPALLTSPPYIPPPPPTTSPTTHTGSGSGTSSACRQARSRASSLSGRLRRTRGFRQRRRIRAQLRRAQVQVRSAC